MQENKTESPLITAGKTVGMALLAFFLVIVTLILLVGIYLFASQTPNADLSMGRVGVDSTFYVGKRKSENRIGGYMSIRASGDLNDSTAVVSVQYPGFDQTSLICKLPKGKFDQVWFGDYYDSRAQISYRHGRVSRGQLRLQIIFSHPPPDWERHLNSEQGSQ
jgi:hypothetical protein